MLVSRHVCKAVSMDGLGVGGDGDRRLSSEDDAERRPVSENSLCSSEGGGERRPFSGVWLFSSEGEGERVSGIDESS